MLTLGGVLSILVSGSLVGLVLGLVGGGGSILAVPLLVYFVGVHSPHQAIGTSSVAVAVSAAINLALHAREGTVKWRCAALFAAAGVLGAWGGATLGKSLDGQKLLALFGALMVLVGVLVLRRPRQREQPEVRLDLSSASVLAPRLLLAGFLAGLLAGFFGIGGGFLIVPALLAATNMPMIAAIGSSLVAVCAFGVTTAVSYASSGLVDWSIAGLFILGGLAGGAVGTRAAVGLSHRRYLLSVSFAALVIAIGLYVIARGWHAIVSFMP
ncbi:MAG TPA: sulfite exporter TauE/SafE family protein [Steroidobacteraceae bacterium]